MVYSFSMELNHLQLEKLQNIFKKMPQVLAVYLYGSRVKGYDLKSSDLDVAVVVDSIEGIDYGDLYFKVSQNIKETEIDLRITTPQKDLVYLYEVIGGKYIYQRSKADRINFETRVLKNFYDGKHIRDIYHHYLKQSFGAT